MAQWFNGMHAYVLAESVEGALEEVWEFTSDNELGDGSSYIGLSTPDLASKNADAYVSPSMKVFKVRVECHQIDEDDFWATKSRIGADRKREKEQKEAEAAKLAKDQAQHASSLHQLLASGVTKASNQVKIDPVDLHLSNFTRLSDGSVRITGTISAEEAKKRGI